MRLSDLNHPILYHGSAWELQPGMILTGHRGGFTRRKTPSISLTEMILAKFRPPHIPSRNSVVFMSDTASIQTLSELGSHANFVYQVEPTSAVSRHAVGWWELINRGIKYSEFTEEQMREFAHAYWSGNPCPRHEYPSIAKKRADFEYLSTHATVIRLVDTRPGSFVIPKPPSVVANFLSSKQNSS